MPPSDSHRLQVPTMKDPYQTEQSHVNDHKLKAAIPGTVTTTDFAVWVRQPLFRGLDRVPTPISRPFEHVTELPPELLIPTQMGFWMPYTVDYATQWQRGSCQTASDATGDGAKPAVAVPNIASMTPESKQKGNLTNPNLTEAGEKYSATSKMHNSEKRAKLATRRIAAQPQNETIPQSKQNKETKPKSAESGSKMAVKAPVTPKSMLNGAKKAKEWTTPEENAVELAMRQLIASDNPAKLTEQKWEILCERLKEIHGIHDRSPDGIKNYWKRKGRARSNLDERIVAKPNQMQTAVNRPDTRREYMDLKKRIKAGILSEEELKQKKKRKRKHQNENIEDYNENNDEWYRLTPITRQRTYSDELSGSPSLCRQTSGAPFRGPVVSDEEHESQDGNLQQTLSLPLALPTKQSAEVGSKRKRRFESADAL